MNEYRTNRNLPDLNQVALDYGRMVSSIVDCASWEISSNKNGLIAICVGCKLAAMCKKLETPSPCRMYCLSAIEGMIKGIAPQSEFNVQSTLWNSPKGSCP